MLNSQKNHFSFLFVFPKPYFEGLLEVQKKTSYFPKNRKEKERNLYRILDDKEEKHLNKIS